MVRSTRKLWNGHTDTGTNPILIHWWTLQNVSNIDSRAFSMNSDLQATRKKSLSNT